MKHYMDIERLKDKYMNCFKVGEHITITEKIDGANASFTYNPETGKIDAFSRKNQLSYENTLRGFYNFTQTLNVEQVKQITQSGKLIIFGEWLVSHSIKYPEDKLNQFYMFDVYHTEKQQYLNWQIVKLFAEQLGIKTVPLFYDGEFQSWDHINAFLGKTEMCGSPTGEGIVIKSQDRLADENNRIPYYVKIVTPQFSEVHRSKEHKFDPEQFKREQEIQSKVAEVVTKRRVQKIIQKFIDEGAIRQDFDEHTCKLV